MDRPAEAEALYAAVGQAVRAGRARAGLTLAQLAAASGVSLAMISKIERGEVSASLASLKALADAMGMPVINLFAATAEQSEVSFVRAGQGVAVRRSGSTYGHDYRLVGRSLSDGIEVEAYLITLTDRQANIPFYHQPGSVEMIQLLRGEMRYRCGETIYDMAPGDTLTFEAGAPHGPTELLSAEVEFLSVSSRQTA